VGDTFSYTVTGGNTVTVTVTVNGVAGPGDWLMGDGTDNVITGTPQADVIVVSQGGNDTISALAGNDTIYFGGALTAADNVTGGPDIDTLVLQGDYSGGLVLDASVTGIERISMLAGTNTAFGDPGTNLYDYDLTIDDANFAAGIQARINGAALLAGEDFTFDGSAETDAKFVIYGGRGTDDLTGGNGNDIFFFADGGRFAAGDVVDGGGGYDGLFLRGNYSIDFTQAGFAGALTGLENLTVSGASDERYARGGGTEFDYSITWDGDLLAGGATMTINGSTLKSEESLAFNGSDESDGNFRLFGGAGNDVLTGGAGTDLIFGGLRGDTLTGGSGNDIFRYDSVGDSNSTERDGIQDFNSGDLIDLSRIDANDLVDGNQAFNFIGNAAFSSTASELRFENISLGGPIWLIQGDTDGNGVSDFELVLVISPADPITATDFIV
jgi:Ca2+-binding RTX toxin-like protein